MIDSISAWRRSLGNARGPMRLSGLALQAMALSEILLVADEKDAENAGMPVTCRKGCGACCRHVVPVSPPEAFLLAEVLAEARPQNAIGGNGNNGAGNPEWEAGFAENLSRLEAAGLGDAPLINHADAYFSLRMPCPFLSEERCSIRAQRPLACREHLVSSDPKHCAGFPDPFIRPMSLTVSVRDALIAAAAEVLATAPEIIPMARVPMWVAANREAGEKEWRAGFLLDRLAQRLGARR